MNDCIYLDDEGLKEYKKSIDNLIKNVDRINEEINNLKKDKKFDKMDLLF